MPYRQVNPRQTTRAPERADEHRLRPRHLARLRREAKQLAVLLSEIAAYDAGPTEPQTEDWEEEIDPTVRRASTSRRPHNWRCHFA
jgi:hypothetical protein